jgi:zinc protease
VNTDLAQLQAVTAADVQRVMKKYFSATNRLVIYYLPKAQQTTSELRNPDGQVQRVQGGQGK